MRILFILSLLFGIVSNTIAQNNVELILLDKSTKEPIPYANVVIERTYKGTATNIDGVMVLKVPDEYINGKLLISAIGYTNMQLSIEKYIDKGQKTIYLDPVSYQINDVTVEAKSLYYYTIIKKAAQKVENNFYQKPFNYDMYYRNTQKVDGAVQKERQAAVRLYDAQGYRKASTYQVFRERTYKFLQVRRNFELNSLSDGTTQLDDLLEFDIARISNNILNADLDDNDWDVKLKKLTVLDGDSVWVLSYNCKNPSLTLTGDVYATAYNGEIYIKKKDFSVIKNITKVQASNYSPLGRSMYVNEERQNYKPLSIEYTFTTNYKQFDDSYFLSSIIYERKHTWLHKKNNQKRIETINAEILVTEILTTGIEEIKGRAYYEELKFNKAFWDKFNFLVDEKKK